MQIGNEANGNHLRRLRGRLARSRSMGTKLTPNEEKRVIAAAETDEKSPSEWVREILLRAAAHGSQDQLERHIFTKLVGLQMLLMGTLSLCSVASC